MYRAMLACATLALALSALCLPCHQALAQGGPGHWQVRYTTSGSEHQSFTDEYGSFADDNRLDFDLVDDGHGIYMGYDPYFGVPFAVGGYVCSINWTIHVVATLRWVNDSGGPGPDPPGQVIVEEEATASVNSQGSWFATAVADVSSGLPDATFTTTGLDHSDDGTFQQYFRLSRGPHRFRVFAVPQDTLTLTVTDDLSAHVAANVTNPDYGASIGSYGHYQVTPRNNPLSILATRIDKDNPVNTSISALDAPNVVYGGSEPSTADDLILIAEPADPDFISYAWSGMGRSGTGRQWDFGPVPPSAGIYTFTCTATDFEGNTFTASKDIEVGIRTDDEIVLGWIDSIHVTVNPAGVSPWLTYQFPAAGPPVPDSVTALGVIGLLSENFNTNLVGPGDDLTTPVDRDYMLSWMFKNASNSDPLTVLLLGNFRNISDSSIDYPKVDIFVSQPTNYKLWNHLQIRYRKGDSGFNGTPVVLQRSFPNTAVGTTVDPIAGIYLPGQTGPNNGLLTTGSNRVSLINDGSPDQRAVKAFNTIVAKDMPAPRFWENIGSKIYFTGDGSTRGVPIVQDYPTYYEFRNGRLVYVYDQALTPIAHFLANPYPFGTATSYGIGGDLPGGRGGDASSPADPSSRNPDYIVP